MIPPAQYTEFLPTIERVFQCGFAPFVHPTGFDATRIITGVTGSNIDPYFTPGTPQRGNASGNHRLFTTDQRQSAFLESLGHTGAGPIPPGTYELTFRFDGQTLNFERVVDHEFRSLYFRCDGTREENHAFSQCVDYYVESKGLASEFDTYGWLSISGQAMGVSGYVHAWKSMETGTLKYVKTVKLEGSS